MPVASCTGCPTSPGSSTGLLTGLVETLPGQGNRMVDTNEERDRAWARQRVAWVESPENRRTTKVLVGAGAVALVSLVAMLGIWTAAGRGGIHAGTSTFFWLLVWGGLGFVAIYGAMIYRLMSHRRFRDRQLIADDEAASASVAEIVGELGGDGSGETEPLSLTVLWLDTQDRLRRYHESTLQRAGSSFLYAQIAVGLGLGALLAAGVVVLSVDNTAQAAVAGGLGAVGAALSGYIGSTFLAMYKQATDQLRLYFDQPVETLRLLAGERAALLLEDPERRSAALELIVSAAVRGAADPARDTSGDPPTS